MEYALLRGSCSQGNISVRTYRALYRRRPRHFDVFVGHKRVSPSHVLSESLMERVQELFPVIPLLNDLYM